MSGRIRSIKPEWLEDEAIALASSDARVLSIALILLADDYGNGRANSLMLAGQVFPGKPLETLAKAIEELEKARFVLRYCVEGQSYFSIRNWDKHQKVDKPGKPRVPAPPRETPGKPPEKPTLENIRETPENIRETLAPDHDHDHDQGSGAELDPLARAREEAAAAAAPVTRIRAKEPGSLPEALKLPIWERSEIVVMRPDLAQWVEPHKWPEVMQVAERLHASAKLATVRLGQYTRDNGVRAVVGLFADGYSLDELLDIAERVPRTEWWNKGSSKGLSSLTPEVIRRSFEAPGAKAHAEFKASIPIPKGWRPQPGVPGWFIDERGFSHPDPRKAS